MDAIFNNSFTRTSAPSGTTLTMSAICRQISGTAPVGVGLRVGVVEETAPSTYIAITTQSSIVSTTEQVHTATRTITSGNQSRIAMIVSLITGETIDVTYRIKAAQFEIGSTRTNYQFNYSRLNITEQGFYDLYYLDTDGVDDWMSTSNIDLSNSDKMTSVVGLRKVSTSAVIILETSLTQVSNAGTIQIRANLADTPNYMFGSRGTASTQLTTSPNNYQSPITNVVTGIGDISGDIAIVRVNGTQQSIATGDQGLGNYGNYPLYLFRRGGTTLSFNGRMYGLVIINKLLTASDLTKLETFINNETKAY
jgi:hypothetical protein